MAPLAVGAQGPAFQLPSAQGPVVDLRAFHGRSNVILWFTKGFGCPFCRQQLSQLIRALPKFRERQAELLVVTRTPLARAKVYARHFDLTVPYLCDDEGIARRAYGLEIRSKPATWYLGKLLRLRHAQPPSSDFGGSGRLGNPDGMRASVTELVEVLADEDTAVFVLDKQGTVRFARWGAMRSNGGLGEVWQLPSADEIVRTLTAMEA